MTLVSELRARVAEREGARPPAELCDLGAPRIEPRRRGKRDALRSPGRCACEIEIQAPVAGLLADRLAEALLCRAGVAGAELRFTEQPPGIC